MTNYGNQSEQLIVLECSDLYNTCQLLIGDIRAPVACLLYFA